MGKGDQKSKRGKINRGTSGVRRQKKKNTVIAKKPKVAPKKKAAVKKSAPKKTTTKKTTTKKVAAKKPSVKKKAED